jgi:hypothetical protein
LYTEKCPKCLGGKYDLEAEGWAESERMLKEQKRRKYGS